MFDDELARIPTHPPRTGILPGMRLGTAVPGSTLLLLIALVALFAFMPLSIVNSDPRAKLAMGPSRTTEGRVLSVNEVAGCRASAARRIVYAFSTDSGSEFRGAAVVCQASPYYVVQPGERIAVRYLTRDPSLNAVAGTDSANEPPVLLFMFFPLFLLLVLSPLYLPQLREVMRARRLYRSGVLTEGKVIFVKKRAGGTWPAWPGSSTAEVYVSHQLPSGERVESIAACTNDWLLNQLAPGTAVHLLLAPESSARAALLEAFIR